MSASNYWKNRVLESEKFAQSIAVTLSKKQEKAYLEAYKRIKLEILDLYSRLEAGETITRTDLWRFGKNEQLKKLIEDQFGLLASEQDKQVFAALEKVYVHTLNTSVDGLGTGPIVFNDLEKLQMKSIITESFQGSNYSDRIYANADQIAERIKNDMQRLISQGTSPDRLIKELQKDFQISYHNADRLVRTEASRVYNKASNEAYKKAGVRQVEYLAENDSCEICQGYGGTLYNIGSAPVLPTHPNCRCCYAPVVEED